MNRSDDEPIEHRGCYERAAAGPQAPRKTGVVVTSLAGGPAAVEAASAWSLVFDEFDQASEGIREALCTLGNGYVATRAAASWSVADGVHYPGTYLAGGYNRLRTNVAGRWSRTRISSISPTGYRSIFASPMTAGSTQ
jgi:hypothetical protein